MRTATRCNGIRRRSRACQRADVKTSLASSDASWRQCPATVHAGQAVAESRPRVARALGLSHGRQLTRATRQAGGATFYTTGMEQSLTSATGTGVGTHVTALRFGLRLLRV